MTLTQAGWGRDDPVYRHIFSQAFMPAATSEEMAWFDEFQRQTTSAENAIQFLQAFAEIDVRKCLSSLKARPLVLHRLRDRRITLATGRALAAANPSAKFVGLDSENHLLLGREPASKTFVANVERLLSS